MTASNPGLRLRWSVKTWQWPSSRLASITAKVSSKRAFVFFLTRMWVHWSLLFRAAGSRMVVLTLLPLM